MTRDKDGKQKRDSAVIGRSRQRFSISVTPRTKHLAHTFAGWPPAILMSGMSKKSPQGGSAKGHDLCAIGGPNSDKARPASVSGSKVLADAHMKRPEVCLCVAEVIFGVVLSYMTLICAYHLSYTLPCTTPYTSLILLVVPFSVSAPTTPSALGAMTISTQWKRTFPKVAPTHTTAVAKRFRHDGCAPTLVWGS